MACSLRRVWWVTALGCTLWWSSLLCWLVEPCSGLPASCLRCLLQRSFGWREDFLSKTCVKMLPMKTEGIQQLTLGVSLRDEATFASFLPGRNALLQQQLLRAAA